MDYKIVQVDASTANIVVEFLLIPGYRVAIDLPVDDDGNVPVGTELDAYIKGFLPYFLIERQAKLASGIVNLDQLMQHVEPAPPAVDANLGGLE